MKNKLILVIIGIAVIASAFFGYSVVNAAESKYIDKGDNMSSDNPSSESIFRAEAITAYQKLTGKNPVAVNSGGYGDMYYPGYWYAIITTDDKYLLLYSTEHKGSFEIIQSPKQPVVRTFSGLTTVKTMVTTYSDIMYAKSRLNSFVVNDK
jgi:hypothetical protein